MEGASPTRRYLIVVRDLGARWRIFAGDHRHFIDLMSSFGETLAADPRFHDVGWFHEHEMFSERRGADRPGTAFNDEPCFRRQEVEDQPVGP